MIAMLIADSRTKERRAISFEAHEQAARQTEEYWEWMECSDDSELKKLVAEDPRRMPWKWRRRSGRVPQRST